MPVQRWDPHLYDDRHEFVTHHGSDLIAELDPRPGERILDAGCGTAALTQALTETGAEVLGIDSSPQMIDRAQRRFPHLDLRIADLRDPDLEPGGFDAVLSNAVLHWIPQAPQAATAIATALRPGGRLVAELGGSGNVAAIRTAAHTLRTEHGLPEAANPWYFPGIDEYTTVLSDAGLRTTGAWLFDRPTRLDGDDGLTTWLHMFAAHLLTDIPDPDSFTTQLTDRLRPHLHHSGHWWADYRRLRITATKPAHRPA